MGSVLIHECKTDAVPWIGGIRLKELKGGD